MKASTIAEIYVERDRVRVELEVGATDILAFANSLPDNVYNSITGRSEPLDQRLETFFTSDWLIRVEGQLLPGKVESVVPAKRLARDDVTGEILASQEEDAESVIRITLEYPLGQTPSVLSIQPPLREGATTANIGFVCYHSGLPVNDFRYLSDEVTLDLDWDDPWYSRFRHPNLRRQFDAPLSTYLYIEPYEVRKEIIVRPIDLQEFLDLKLSKDEWIRTEQQEELKRQVADYLADKNPVTIDGQIVEGQLDRIHFIQRTLRSTGIIEPPVDLDTTSATLGVIYVYPVERLPQKVSMVCDLFTPKIQAIPAVASDEAGGLPGIVTPEEPVLVWKNYLINPKGSELLDVAPPPSRRSLAVPVASIFCACVAGILCFVMGRQSRSGHRVSRLNGIVSISVFLLALVLLPYARITVASPFVDAPRVSEQEARDILASLLHNVYRSFDHHDEGLIYDRLAKSIFGDLLAEVYLQTRRSMEVKNQGGLRISVKEVAVTELEPTTESEQEMTYRCRWHVRGWIGHWGHVHARENEHLAIITIADREGQWKITSLEMLDQPSAETSSTSTMTQRDREV